MTQDEKLALFQGFGVELEYMLVDKQTLSVRPVTDRILHAVAGAYEAEVERGPLSWSNELVLHVIELKTNGPTASLDPLTDLFQNHVRDINDIADRLGARLMPTAMHPWMDPHTETRLWPHEHNAVYAAFDRIFGCKGHGWSNLQSTHLNLPFATDEEFGRLHAAIRLILPILPGLAASSPIHDRALTGLADARLEAYRHNARRIPSISGLVIPEPVFTRRDYENLLNVLYRDIAPHDPDRILQHEWLNARGAIARFDRNTIEIRVLDIQECPQADLAILALLVAVLRATISEKWVSYPRQCQWFADRLARIFLSAVRDGDGAVITDADYLRVLGLENVESCTVGELWRHLFDELSDDSTLHARYAEPLRTILDEGCLARRIRSALDDDFDDQRLHLIYRELCDCLQEGRLFRAECI